MIAITTYPVKDHDLKNNLEWVGDLVYTDEPILSLFRDIRNSNLYLFDWVDADNTTNRWLVYKIHQSVLSEFINKAISFREMLNNIKMFFVTDIKSGQNPPFDIQRLEKLPIRYCPDTDLLFDESDTRNLDKINSVLDSLTEKSRQQSSVFDLSKNEIPYSKQYRIIKEQYFSIDIFSFPSNANNVKDIIPSSTLPPQNEIKPNRVFQNV